MMNELIDLEIEKSVIAAILAEPQRIYNVKNLKAIDFDSGLLFKIFEGMLYFAEQRRTIDYLSLYNHFKRDGESSKLLDLMMSLEGRYIGNSIFYDYIDILKQLSQKRRLIELSHELSAWAVGDKDVTSIVQEVGTRLDQITEFKNKDIRTNNEIAKSITQRIKDIQGGKVIVTRLTGIERFDKFLKVMEGEMIVIAGPSNVGKSMFANTIAGHCGKDRHILIFSLEMSDESYAHRLMSYYSGINTRKMRTATVDINSTHYIEAYDNLITSNVHICDKSNLSAFEIEMEVMRWKRRKQCDIVIIDHGILLDFGESRHNRADQIGEASRRIQQMTQSLNVITVLLWQLNKDGAEGRPSVANLRSSGRVNEDADSTILLWKHDDGHTVATIAKNRHGEAGIDVPIVLVPDSSKFIDKPEEFIEPCVKRTI